MEDNNINVKWHKNTNTKRRFNRGKFKFNESGVSIFARNSREVFKDVYVIWFWSNQILAVYNFPYLSVNIYFTSLTKNYFQKTQK